MLCSNCSKLMILYTKKKCVRCQSDVIQNISVICEYCSLRENICAACLKKINNPSLARKKGCNCGS